MVIVRDSAISQEYTIKPRATPLKSTPMDTQQLCKQAMMECLKYSHRTYEVGEREKDENQRKDTKGGR